MASPRRQIQIKWPPFTRGVIALAIFFFVTWFVGAIFPSVRGFIQAHLALDAPAIVDGLQLWTLLTYGAFHQTFFEVFFAVFALWVFGAELESRWSAVRWWGMQLCAVALGGVLVFLVELAIGSDMIVTGYHGAIMSLITAYCIYHWRSPLYFFFFAMTGRTMLLFFAGLSIVLGLVGGYWPVVPIDGAGILVGYLAAKRLNLRDLRTRFRLWRARRKLKVVKRPEDDGGKKKPNGSYIN